MSTLKPIPKKLHKGSFTYQEGIEAGLKVQDLRKHVAAGSIVRLDFALYCVAGAKLSFEERVESYLKILKEPAAVCLYSALHYHGLLDKEPDQMWLMVRSKKRALSRNIRLYRCQNPKWKTGMIESKGVLITNIERTIVEFLVTKQVVPAKVGVDALKKAIAKKKTTAQKVYEMAEVLQVPHRAMPFLEKFL